MSNQKYRPRVYMGRWVLVLAYMVYTRLSRFGYWLMSKGATDDEMLASRLIMARALGILQVSVVPTANHNPIVTPEPGTFPVLPN